MGNEADLLSCRENSISSVSDSEVQILDGSAVINLLKLGVAKTFNDFSSMVFTLYIKEKLERANRLDVVWDCYDVNSLKSLKRQKRVKGTRTRVDGKNKIPTNWKGFLRVDKHKTELSLYGQEACGNVNYQSCFHLWTQCSIISSTRNRSDCSLHT